MLKRISLMAILILAGVAIGVVMGGAMGSVARAGFLQAPVVAQLGSGKAPSQAPAANVSAADDSTVITTVKKAEPAVVTIVNTSQTQTQRNGVVPSVAEGSGVIIDPQGHIITNAHVVANEQQLDVIMNDGSKTTAKLIGADTVSDIAVLQVNGNVLAYLPLGDSSALQLGQTVIAIGSPLGSYRGSVTTGVVSGLNRSVSGSGQEDLIQTDAAINHGNSGGPLLNLNGEVIGINTLVVQNTNSGDIAQGLGFAIPSKTVSAIAQQLLSQGKIEYPFIGISYAEITPASAGVYNLSSQHGALVQDVTPGSPAANAGLRPDDIITALNNQTIDETHSLRSILFQSHVGDTVTAAVMRGGQTLSLKLTLVARPVQSGSTTPG
jgi:2-alkenal reductase